MHIAFTRCCCGRHLTYPVDYLEKFGVGRAATVDGPDGVCVGRLLLDADIELLEQLPTREFATAGPKSDAQMVLPVVYEVEQGSLF